MVLEGKKGYNSEKYWERRNKDEINNEQVIDKETIDFIKPFVKGRDVLDIGCGKGKLCTYLTESEYTGADISQVVLEKAAREHPSGEFILINENWDQLKEFEFDVIVSVNVLQHLPLSKSIAFLRNAYSCLKSEGVLLLYEGRIIDATRGVVETMYQSASCAEHMIPKPLGDLKQATKFEWEKASNLQWVLRKRGLAVEVVGKFLTKD